MSEEMDELHFKCIMINSISKFCSFYFWSFSSANCFRFCRYQLILMISTWKKNNIQTFPPAEGRLVNKIVTEYLRRKCKAQDRGKF